MAELFPGSVHSRCVDATADSVVAAFASVRPTVAVYKRKRPVLLEGDSIPCAVVAPAPDGPRIVRETFSLGVQYGYPVVVALFFPSNAVATAVSERYAQADETAEREYADVQLASETVRNALYRPTLSAVSSVFDCEIVVSPAFETASDRAGTYAVAAVTVTYHSLESRVA